MDAQKVRMFMQLGGQRLAEQLDTGDERLRKLGAQLLLSETLEYVIKGLGVLPSFDGTVISDANALSYQSNDATKPDPIEMLDGLSDVAYTMYWNALAFGLRLEEAFERVCDNNLEKFVFLERWHGATGPMAKEQWHCDQGIAWPSEVVEVEVIKVGVEHYAVGRDGNGKVRKPSHYRSVRLDDLVEPAPVSAS
ncbi:MAG: hypothetical protein KDD44_04515 [Bdellovibrionales bacterium]|nr:hypothetical protein [Bdellovibrionales bacterium]